MCIPILFNVLYSVTILTYFKVQNDPDLAGGESLKLASMAFDSCL